MRLRSRILFLIAVLPGASTGCFPTYGFESDDSGARDSVDSGPSDTDSGASGGADSGSGGTARDATADMGAVSDAAHSADSTFGADATADAMGRSEGGGADTDARGAPFDASTADGGPARPDASALDGGSNVLRLVQSFAAPGDLTNGIAWDGAHVWLSDNSATLFEVDTNGHLVNSFTAPEGTPQGIVWDGSSFWLYTTSRDLIYQYQIGDGATDLSILGTIGSPAQIVGGGINNDLAWDGQNLWQANEFKAYRMTTSGTVVGSFSFPKNIAGIDWDGAHFWITYSNGAGTIFAAVDGTGQVLATFPSPVSDIESIAWGAGDHVWGFGGGLTGPSMVYEIDATSALAVLP